MSRSPPYGVACRQIRIEQTIRLRHSVLWPNMPISHVYLPEDESGIHMGAFLPGIDDPIAVISFFVEPLPITPGLVIGDREGQSQARFRKFACDPTFQGRGIGTKLLEYSLEWVKSQINIAMVWCDARTSSVNWYTKRGMTPFGNTFHKETVEYVRMYIDISVSGSKGTSG